MKRERIWIAAIAASADRPADRSVAYFYRCSAELARGEAKAAVADCTEAIRLNVNYGEALCWRAIASNMLGRNDAALRDLNLAVRLLPQSSACLRARASVNFALGRRSAAIADLGGAITLAPGRMLYRYERAWVLRAAGDAARARADLEVVAQAWADDADDFLLKGNALRLLGQTERAIEAFDEAIRRTPALAMAHSDRALALIQAGRHGEAIAAATRAIELDPADPYAPAARAHALQLSGKPAEAQRDYETAMSLGGGILVRSFQRGLKEARLYGGALDDKIGPQLRDAFAKCVADPKCDPRPRDER